MLSRRRAEDGPKRRRQPELLWGNANNLASVSLRSMTTHSCMAAAAHKINDLHCSAFVGDVVCTMNTLRTCHAST